MCDGPSCWYDGIRQHLDVEYHTYDSEDECTYCGVVHFGDDGTVVGDCRNTVSVKNKWRDIRRTV